MACGKQLGHVVFDARRPLNAAAQTHLTSVERRLDLVLVDLLLVRNRRDQIIAIRAGAPVKVIRSKSANPWPCFGTPLLAR